MTNSATAFALTDIEPIDETVGDGTHLVDWTGNFLTYSMDYVAPDCTFANVERVRTIVGFKEDGEPLVDGRDDLEDGVRFDIIERVRVALHEDLYYPQHFSHRSEDVQTAPVHFADFQSAQTALMRLTDADDLSDIDPLVTCNRVQES